jgi:uncharacterized protein YegJ (DUF2314 family)
MSTENIPMYYYSENGEVVGPFTVQELAGKITPDSMVVSENATKWVKASDVPEISDILFVQQSDELQEFTPDELDVEDDSLLEVETENLEIITPSAPVKNNNNNNHVVYANENNAKSRLWIFLIIIVSLLVVIGGSVFFYFKSDYYKWKSAVKMYCFADGLFIRSDTITIANGRQYDDNKLAFMAYGESYPVLDNPILAPWVDVKYGDKLGHVNGSYLMPENEFDILKSLLNNDDKRKKIKVAKYRKSLVNYVIAKSKLNSISEFSWSIEYYDYPSYYKIIKNDWSDVTNAIILKLKNPKYSEYVIFLYNGNNEIDKKGFLEDSNATYNISEFLSNHGLSISTDYYD